MTRIEQTKYIISQLENQISDNATNSILATIALSLADIADMMEEEHIGRIREETRRD